MEKDKHRYDFMLDMPHKQSIRRKRMTMLERAAQFGAFRALTGHEAAIAETGRLTDERIQLDEYQKSNIDRNLRYLKDNLPERKTTVTYFVPDKRKQGGEYVTKTGIVQAVYEFKRQLAFCDTLVPIDDIVAIEIDGFDEM